jgi:hypothetical protein
MNDKNILLKHLTLLNNVNRKYPPCRRSWLVKFTLAIASACINASPRRSILQSTTKYISMMIFFYTQ